MVNKLLHELLSTCVYWIREEYFANYHRLISENILQHISAENVKFDPKQEDYKIYIGKENLIVVPVASAVEEGGEGAPTAPEGESIEGLNYVLMIHVCGPITRSGDMCTYGSIDHRDLLLSAAQDEYCEGVCFVIDTPGGSAFAMHDYRQGMDAIKEAGKRSISFVDGQCCSAGIALACQTDYIVCMNGADEVGCIGAMCAGWLPVHNSVVDGYRFIHITADQTPEKNEIFRDASEGDFEKIQGWISESAEEFLALIEEMRPQILPEQRKGKVYRADSVIGTIVDGIGTIDDCVNYISTGELNLAVMPSATTAPPTPNNNNNPKKENKMPEMNNILAALNLEELPVQDGGIFLNGELVNQLNEALAKGNTSEAPAAPAASATPAAPAAGEAGEGGEAGENGEGGEGGAPAAPAAGEGGEGGEGGAPAAGENGAPAAGEGGEGAQAASDQHEQEMQALRDQHEQEMQALRDQHEQEMQALRDQHEQEMQPLRDQLAELAAAAPAAPAPKNNGAQAAAAATPVKEYRNMTLEEKKAYWNSLGKGKK